MSNRAWTSGRAGCGLGGTSSNARCPRDSSAKTAIDREILRAVPVREYGPEQPVRLAIDPVGEVEGIGIAVTAADPKPDEPKPARGVTLADIDRDRPTELPGRRVEGVD